MIKVFLVCSGLGRIRRGYESFTQECFDALSQDTSLDITLFKGGENSSRKEIPLWSLPREAWITKQLATITSKDSYFVEQVSFCLSLIPHIYQKKPDVIIFSDFNLGTILWHLRRLCKFSYKLLFSNGAPNGPPFSRMDCVQHLTPVHYHSALEAGESASRHSVVPYGIATSNHLNIPSKKEQEFLRRQLNLPIGRPILLSVGAINKTHKRMDYLIHEVASLPEPRPYLVLLGQFDAESPEIIQLGNLVLGIENFQVRTVTVNEVKKYYKVADAFILASLTEGLARVLLEAMSYGLPCLTHDYQVTRFALKNEGYFANFELPGSLVNLITQVLAENHENSKYRRHQLVYEHFSWEKLRPSYVQMIQHCTSNKL